MENSNVLIIGCGSIGALKDDKYDSPGGKNILTLAHAFYNHPSTSMLVFYDKEMLKARQASIKWNGNYYTSLENAITDSKPEIIVVSVDTEYHENILWEIYKLINKGHNYKPKLVICEKPFTYDLNNALQISVNFESVNVPIMVDYSRRFDPSLQNFKKQLESRDFHPIYNAVLTYTRGFKRDASHGIDLFNYLFGEFRFGCILNKEEAFNDFSKNDPTYAAYLSYERCPHVFLVPVDGRDYDVFDLSIFAQKSKFCFIDHGKILYRYLARPELTYGNYDSMPIEPIYKEDTSLTHTLSLLAENAFDFIEKNSKLLCTSEDAVKVHKIFKSLGI